MEIVHPPPSRFGTLFPDFSSANVRLGEARHLMRDHPWVWAESTAGMTRVTGSS